MIPYALKYGRSVKYFLKSKSGCLCAKNNVPTSSPATTLLTLFRSSLFTMTNSCSCICYDIGCCDLCLHLRFRLSLQLLLPFSQSFHLRLVLQRSILPLDSCADHRYKVRQYLLRELKDLLSSYDMADQSIVATKLNFFCTDGIIFIYNWDHANLVILQRYSWHYIFSHH